MKQINNYITEKLYLNKDIKVNNVKNPFDLIKFDEPADLLHYIVETFENDCLIGAYIWDDSKIYNARDDFKNFVTNSGKSIDWLDSFAKEVNKNMVAIFQIIKSKQANIENHPFTKFFKNEFEEDIRYEKEGYVVKYWGDYEYKKNIIISMMIAPTGEARPDIIAFIIKRHH